MAQALQGQTILKNENGSAELDHHLSFTPGADGGHKKAPAAHVPPEKFLNVRQDILTTVHRSLFESLLTF